MPRDVAGISRPGYFDTLSLGTPADGDQRDRTTARIASGTGSRLTLIAQGDRATASPRFEAPNTRDPYTLAYAAERQGAIRPEPLVLAGAWPSPPPMKPNRSRRK